MSKKLLDRAEYLLQQEKGTVFKDPGGKITIALVYPNSYRLGMSNLGFQGIYGLLNSREDVVCERAFLPDREEWEEYERTGAEIFTLESKRPLGRFDIVAFSVSFENDYPNVVKLLRLARIPVRSSERRPGNPVVIMGGVCAFYNPEPLADFVDICFVGEAEEMLPEFLDVFRASSSKEELFGNSTKLGGVYVPRFYQVSYSGDEGGIISRNASPPAPAVVRKRTVPNLSLAPMKPLIMTPEAEFSDMYLLETMRGCVWSCRFCVAGRIYKPVRRKDRAELGSEIREALAKTRRVGLIGPSLSDYPGVEEVLSIEGVDYSITSLRASPRSGRIVGLMKGHKSVSIAPEAGTQRLRNVINKRISEEDILETARIILDGGIETLRLYFMIGLPTETIEDVDGIIALVKKVRGNTAAGFITLSVSTFVPKPFTPFQWHPMGGRKEVKERLAHLKKGLSRVKGVRVFHDVLKYAYLQGMFAVGDRRLSSLAEFLADGGEFSLKKTPGGSDPAFFLFRQKDRDEILPWDFIDAGVPKERLWDEYREAVCG
ncbi:MAG: radical SAM protein [Nitrospiraceae bacterium]|nr:radical SAM protein [Nitrospiraceae bacterium]